MSMAIKAAKFQGDPGLFGFLGAAAKKLGGAAFRTLAPGPVRAAVGIGAGFLGGRVSPSAPTGFAVPGPARGRLQAAGSLLRAGSQGFARPGTGFQTPTPVTRVPGIRGLAQRILPGGATGFETVGAGGVGLPPTGFHINRTGYFLTNAAEFGTFVAPGSRFVRNRRRNPGNMRAADRAITRIEQAKRMAKRLSRITVRSRCPKN